MTKEYQFEPIKETDFPEINVLAKMNGGNTNLSVEALNHQYLNNPSQSFSLWKVVRQNKIEGYATTNNFNFILENKNIVVAMPQNVLVSETARGAGLFGKLYNFTERQNREEKGINTFLTFTNGMSTPIFIKKFGYLRGLCPDLIFYVSSILFLNKDITYTLLASLSEIDFKNFAEFTQLNNTLIKDIKYFNWRYKSYNTQAIRVLKISKENKIIGFGILKVVKKKGLSFLLLMDIIAITPAYTFEVVNACRHYCSKNIYAGLLLFKLADIEFPKSILKLTFKERFNFLVKGRNEIETIGLSKLNFNFYLGDMDSF